MARSRLRAPRQDPQKAAGYARARETVHDRAGGRCEVCTARVSCGQMHAHHRLPRSAGRDDSPSNLMCLCARCHGIVHGSPTGAVNAGWVIPRHDLRRPDQVPVILVVGGRSAWFLLGGDGSRIPLPAGPTTVTV